MKLNKIATATLIASVALSPASPVPTAALADTGDLVAGLIVGGIIGSAVTKDKKKKSSVAVSSVSSAQREANKEVQTSLNYFGYNVGTPDGSIGPKSRAAISEYQAFLGYPATGELTENERLILVTAYQRAVAGGSVIADVVSSSPYGLKAILIAQRDEMAGVAPATGLVSGTTAPAPGSVTEATIAALPHLIPETGAEEEGAAGSDVTLAAVEEPEVTEDPVLPSFMAPSGANGSLASACADIEQTTAANGGLTTAATMVDADFALGEQFCVARVSAMDTADGLSAKIAGFTPEQISAQCAAFGPVLESHVAALSLKPASDVLAGVEEFILTSGMSPAQLSGTAKVCLGSGYAEDDMNVAIGSALLLTAMGEQAYAEYLGHHLSQGFGASERPDLAMDWYQMALDAMANGQLVVAPDVTGRDALILKASYTIGGRASELPPETAVQEAALPVFEVAPEAVAVTETAAATEETTELDALAEEVAVDETEAVTTEVAEALPEVLPAADAAGAGGNFAASDTQLLTLAVRVPLMILTGF